MKRILALALALILALSMLVLASCEKTCKYEGCEKEPAEECEGYCKAHYAIVKGGEILGDLFS